MSRICLALHNRNDAKFLSEWIEEKYELYEISGDSSFPERIDLLIIDGVSLNKHMKKVARLKQASAPVILPVLLLTTRKELGMSSKLLWAKIDELIFIPVEKRELQARINHLLLTRQLSLNLKTLNEQKLSIQAEKYLKMFQKNPQSMWIYDLETLQFLEVNDAAVNHYGYSREEFLSMTLKDIRPSEDVPSLLEDVKNTWSEHNFAGVWRHVKKNGELIFVSITSHEIDHLGRLARHVMVTDVTREIISREALRVSESNFRQLFEKNVSVMLIIDPDTGCILDANNAALDYYGYTKEEITGLKIHDINTIGTGMAPELDQAKNAEAIYFEFRHRKKNGEIRDVEIFSSRILLEGKIRLHSIIHDVTEKKMALGRIKLLGSAIEHSPVSVMITNGEGEIEYVNPKFTETSGYSLIELIGKNPRILKSGKQPEKFYADLWGTIKSGKIWQGELINRHKDGALFWENLIIAPVQNKDGRISHFVAVKEDVTEAKAMLQSVFLAKEQAEEANRIKSSFLSNMSHELRTPLIAILGFAELLKEGTLDQSNLEMVESIESSGRRLFETLKAILEISRIEGSNLPVNFELIDIGELISARCIYFENIAVSKKLQLKKAIPETNLYASLDRRLLTQVIDNLLDNAIKFTPQGEIIVSLEKKFVPLVNGVQETEVLISVDDTGIGIEPEKHESVFEEFRQASEGYSRSFEGNGLGLSLVKKFTEKMGGRVELISQPGKGSSFRLHFPLVPDEHISIIASSDENLMERHIRKPAILLVEDDPLARELVNRMLVRSYLVDSAVDGQEAIEKVKSKCYSLILLDINLGLGMSGLAALNEIRKVSGYDKVPVVALTAYNHEGFKEYTLTAGCDDYVSKPFSLTQLLQTVVKWTGNTQIIT